MVPRLGIVLGLLLIAGLFHLVAFPASYKRNVRNPRIWRGILDEQMGRIKRITTGGVYFSLLWSVIIVS